MPFGWTCGGLGYLELKNSSSRAWRISIGRRRRNGTPFTTCPARWTRTYEDRLGQYLMITSSAGVVVIRGPWSQRVS
jgi:hypothetical protein